LNKPAETKQGWQAKWYLWDGGFLAIGSSTVVVPSHAHHAIQIVLTFDGRCGLASPGSHPLYADGLIVTADSPHEFHTTDARYALLLMDPETLEGRWLRKSYPAGISALAMERSAASMPLMRAIDVAPTDAAGIARSINAAVRAICIGPEPQRPVDERIRKALEVIRAMDTSRITLEHVAAQVYLSPSRFAHLFTEHVGLPFRRYVLWRRLTRAMMAVGRGKTLTAAAHECGFSDSAHLTRACYQMLGLPPSVLLLAGEFWEIPAPFDVVTAAA
jgi:AraC-like DNA-binding protein